MFLNLDTVLDEIGDDEQNRQSFLDGLLIAVVASYVVKKLYPNESKNPFNEGTEKEHLERIELILKQIEVTPGVNVLERAKQITGK